MERASLARCMGPENEGLGRQPRVLGWGEGVAGGEVSMEQAFRELGLEGLEAGGILKGSSENP